MKLAVKSFCCPAALAGLPMMILNGRTAKRRERRPREVRPGRASSWPAGLSVDSLAFMDMRAEDDDIKGSALGNGKKRPPSALASPLHAPRRRNPLQERRRGKAGRGGHEPGPSDVAGVVATSPFSRPAAKEPHRDRARHPAQHP